MAYFSRGGEGMLWVCAAAVAAIALLFSRMYVDARLEDSRFRIFIQIWGVEFQPRAGKRKRARPGADAIRGLLKAAKRLFAYVRLEGASATLAFTDAAACAVACGALGGAMGALRAAKPEIRCKWQARLDARGSILLRGIFSVTLWQIISAALAGGAEYAIRRFRTWKSTPSRTS